jgi:ceramide glucosyltransferase
MTTVVTNWLAIAIGLIFVWERIIKYLSIKYFFHTAKNFEPISSNYKVSILQPILSGDSTLWNCLRSNLSMKTCYEIEFIWLVDDSDRVGLDGCQELIKTNNDRKVVIVSLPQSPDKISPKTFKLIEGLKYATGDIIVVLDDDTILPDWGLEKALPYLDEISTGLVFGLPYYINWSNFWSSLVSAFVNGNSLFTYIPYTFLIEPFTINGMFLAIKKDILQLVGGFTGLESEICDDYAIAKRFRDRGYRLIQTPLLHGISTQVDKGQRYFNLMTRWLIFPQASIMKSANWRELIIFYLVVLLPNFFPLITAIYLLISPSWFLGFVALIYFLVYLYITFVINEQYLEKATPKLGILLIVFMQIILPLAIFWSLIAPKKIDWRGHIMELDERGGFKFIQRRGN